MIKGLDQKVEEKLKQHDMYIVSSDDETITIGQQMTTTYRVTRRLLDAAADDAIKYIEKSNLHNFQVLLDEKNKKI